MKNFKDVLWWIVGFFMTIMFPPLAFTIVTWLVFPRLSISFVQLFWIVIMIWLAINYITINIEKAIEKINDKK